ncbi:hypothetical protein Hanom_Chr05g00448991 [Helianthus anomalus]
MDSGNQKLSSSQTTMPLTFHFSPPLILFRPTTAEHYHATSAPSKLNGHHHYSGEHQVHNLLFFGQIKIDPRCIFLSTISFLCSSDFVNGSEGEIQICNNFTYFL